MSRDKNLRQEHFCPGTAELQDGRFAELDLLSLFSRPLHLDFPSSQHTSGTMNSLRVARSVARARPTAFRAPLQRRSYADVAADKIQLSLALPHQVRSFRTPIGFWGLESVQENWLARWVQWYEGLVC